MPRCIFSSRKPSHLLFAIASVLAFGIPSVNAQSAQAVSSVGSRATPRIVERVDESRLTVLSGNTRPEARAEFDRGPVAPALKMGDLILVLRRDQEQQAAFDAFLASQQDPSSPNYHHWLRPDEIGHKFGPAQSDISAITGWLQSHGLSVTSVSPDGLSIRFDGTASQVQRTFHIEIDNLEVKGESHIANMNDPSIPEALAPVVVGVKALHNFFPRPQHKLGGVVQRNSQGGGWRRIGSPTGELSKSIAEAPVAKQVRSMFGTGGPATGEANIEDVAPYDFATIYNVLPAWNSATPIIGTGQTIAIAGRSNINLADVTAFRASFGLPAYTAANAPQVIVTNVDPGDCASFAPDCQGDLVENSLDVEWSGAIAPGAQIALVTSSTTSTTTDALFASEQYIVDNVTAKIMNVSYGECELGLGAAENAVYNTLWSTAQMAGIAVFVASGDSGSASCDAGGDSNGVPYGAQFGLSVSGIASTPYDTAVGGTDFAWSWVNNGNSQATYWGSSNNATTQANALGYIPEFPWNSTCSNPLLVSLLNSANSLSDTAGQWCDAIGTQAITFTNEQSFLDLVDTIGGSGGPSNCVNGDGSTLQSCTQGYPKPSFQTGVTGIPNDHVRDIPDVSFFAASGFSGSAYVICVSAAGACSYTQANEPIGEEVGGTSVASPIMAAVAALVNQKVGVPQGNLNSQLYKLAAKETFSSCSSESIPLTGSSCIFNDIDTGTNAMPCDVGSLNCSTGTEVQYNVLTGYAAAPGYDLASGLGSINVANLVNTYTAAASPLITPSPTLLLFASTAVGTSNATTQVVTLTNTGTNALTISDISIIGANATSFSQANTCGTGIAQGASCTVTVTFAPTTSGSLAATLNIADDASGTPQTVSLNGSGVVPAPVVSFNPASLTFASTAVNASAPTQSISLTNSGTAALTITGISITGANGSSFTQTNNCPASPATLAAAASCTVTVTFTPTASGSLTASVSVADNASGSPQTVSLAGTGAGAVAASFTVANSGNITVNPGAATGNTSTITVTPAGGFTGAVSLSCSVASPTGATDPATCSIPASVTISGATAQTSTLTVATTAASSALNKPLKLFWPSAGGAALAAVFFFGIPARRRSWVSMLGLLVLFASIAAIGCGGGGSNTGGGGGNTGTTPGNYTVTVTATAGAITQTTPVTVTVN